MAPTSLSRPKPSRASLPTMLTIFSLTVIVSISLILRTFGTVNNIFINTFNGYFGNWNMILTVMYQQWYFVGITHVPSHIASLRILRPSHINSERRSSVDLSYQPINEPSRYCSGIFLFFSFVLFCFLLFCKCAKRKRKRKTKKTTLSLHNSAVFRSFVISFF